MPTATLSGKVTADAAPLPGVTVSVASPNLQGVRTAVTSEAGDYIFPNLPPGTYTVTFELAGMQTVQRRIVLTVARTDRMDVSMGQAALSEAITVTAETPVTAVLESPNVTSNFKQDLIEQLPVARNLQAVTLLAPGVNDNGPGGNISISGAMSFDSLYLVNGAIVNENLRGQSHNLFIEDAIQETTVMTGGISAEYGHFTGGVVSAVTRSGGNEFSGSFRTNFTNESWVAETPLTVEQDDTINDTHEATLGGPFLRDRLWFFGAGRLAETSDIRQTTLGAARSGDTGVLPLTYPHGLEETRLEGKLTGAITPRHNLVVSYIDVAPVETNQHFDVIMDLASLNAERETPNTMLALNYNGALSSRFFVEGQYASKEYAFIGSGSRFTDMIQGTLILDRARGTRYNSPTFKYKPEGEERNHELFTVKGTWFLSTQNLGTHDIKVGFEDFMEVRDVNNYQSGSDWRLSIPETIIRDGQIFPRMPGGATGTLTRIIWTPIFVLSQGSEYASQSVFLNDRWTFNERWTFNVGARFDKNDAISGDHSFQIADDSAISPRLAVHFDPFANGRLIVNAGYGQYVGRLSEGIGNDADPAGRNASFQWNYRGPSINNDIKAPTSSLTPTHQAIQMIFDWFNANGGIDRRPFRSVSVPGTDTILDPNGLVSPNVKEWVLGVGSAFSTKGYVRADLILRNWDDFYVSRINQSTGKVNDEFGNTYDLAVVGNDSDVYDREYTGVQTQFSYRLTPRVNFGGTYTWSRLVGNLTGENSGSGPITGVGTEYPEYREEEWNYPTGYLNSDQRHRLRAWATAGIPIPFGDLNVSLLQNFDSGLRSSYDGSIDSRGYVNDLGYKVPPSSVSYYFGGRGTIKGEDITRTDLSLNYSAKVAGVELFFQPEVINVFNEQGVEGVNEEVLTALDEDYLAPFNPFTETPIMCPQGASPDQCESLGAHWQPGESFGKPTSESSYQTPRTFRFSVGVRF
ncbi:MAG TPA: TonB-dependent receptor [Thermoanaerobaculia bacterium]|nr:TonB-dependent receptor [Thermoanaerobaculia bacterium]